MKKQLKSDSALKVLSLVIAIALWFYVVQVESPDINRTIKDVPVVFTQKSLLEERQLILLNDNEYTIDVEIRGSRKYAMEINRENLTVLADVGNIESTGQHVVLTSTVLPYANIQVVDKNPSTLTVDVDHLITAKKPVEVMAEGTPKNTYAVGDVTVSPESVAIKGPKSIVDAIQTVAAVLDVSDKSADVAAKIPLTVLGSSEKEIKSQLLSFDIGEAEVRAEILKTKTLPIKPRFYSETTDHHLDESSIKEVRLAGTQAILDAMTHIETLPFSEHDINQKGEVSVKLSLPQGIRSLDGDTFTLRFVTPAAKQTGNQSQKTQ